MQAVLDFIRGLLEEFAPTLALLLYNYEESKVDKANNDKEKAEVDLQLAKNHEEIDAKYAHSSDADIVGDAIVNGGGDKSELKTSDPTSGTATAGNNTGSDTKS